MQISDQVDILKLNKYQDHLLGMARVFNEFCKEHSLCWILVGGSALGAYRHSGFIPWDDDIDIAMPRDDFENMEHILAECGNELDGLRYSPVDSQLIPEAPIGHFYDTKVTNGDIASAPKLDIHPLDGVPTSGSARKKQKLSTLIYYLGIYHHPTKNKGKFMRAASGFLLKVIPDRMWLKLEKKTKAYFTSFSIDESEELCSLFGVAGYEREIMPKEWVLPVTLHEFQGEMFPVPGDKNSYLSRLYGDWERIPDLSERKPQHDGYKVLP